LRARKVLGEDICDHRLGGAVNHLEEVLPYKFADPEEFDVQVSGTLCEGVVFGNGLRTGVVRVQDRLGVWDFEFVKELPGVDDVSSARVGSVKFSVGSGLMDCALKAS